MITDLVRECFWTALVLAGPVLLVSAVVGVAVGLFQAATQVHEMTLVFVPKFILVGLVTILLGHWQWAIVVRFAGRLLAGLPGLAR